MKKLLAISLLLLALVLTVVACQNDNPPTDTTVAETTAAEEPTAAPTDPEDTTAPEDPTAAPETTEAPTPETTAEPETTEKPEVTTEKPEEPTEPPVTEPETEDPTIPVNFFDAEALTANTATGNGIQSAERIEDFLRITPKTSDPNYYPFSNVDGARYVAIKYRTDNAAGTAIQFYLSSTGTSPKDDTSMLRQSIIADGEWHIALFDTRSLIDAGIYDGTHVSYFRFDPLECDYVLDADGNPQKDATNTFIRYPMPEGATIDLAYVAFYDTADGALLRECSPAYIATPADLATKAVSVTNVAKKDGYVTLTGTDADGWISALDAGSVADLRAYFVSLRYRTTVEASGEFFAGSGAGATGGSEQFFNYNADGEWHTVTVDVSALSDMSGALNYIRYDYYGNCTDKSIDIAYIAVFENAAQAAMYDSIVNRLPEDTHNFAVKSADETGDTVIGSTLDSVFAARQAAAGPSVIKDGNYYLVDFFEAIATPDGTYAYTTDIVAHGSDSLSMMFVRGVYNFNFGDGGYFGCITNNGKSTSEGGSATSYAGSAGIYLLPSATADGASLNIRFQCWDGSAVSFKEYEVAVPSTKITVVDMGTTVSVISGGKLAAEITITGKRDFGYTGQNNAVVDPDACASKVTIKTLQVEEVVENAVVASGHLSQIGLATRAGGGSLTVSEVSLMPASSVTVPSFPVIPDDLSVEKVDFIVGEPIMVTAYGEGTDWVGIANRGDTSKSIAYYYVADISGTAVNLLENATTGSSIISTLPAGDYTIYLIPDDKALAASLEDGSCIASIDISVFDPILLNYVTDGLVSCYSGKGYSHTVWTDLVGDNDLAFKADKDNYISDTGLHSFKRKHAFNNNIVNLVNGDTFTVEILFGDFQSVGESYNTFMNSSNDRFALFIRCGNGQLEYKFAGNGGDQRVKIDNGLELVQNSLVTVTYTVGGNCRIYVDGKLMGEMPAPSAMGANDLFIGHSEAAKLFDTTYKSIRFYDRELTAAEVLANAQADGVAN